MNIINNINIDFDRIALQFVDDNFKRDRRLDYRGLYWYCIYLVKSIPIKKRNVHLSRELQVPSGYEPQFKKIRDEIENGEDLNKYLTKNLKKLHVNDELLYHWGIHHLHFSESKSRHLLFIQFVDDQAYIIGVFEHRQWFNQDVLNIVQSNWPELIVSLDGILAGSVTRRSSPGQRRKLRTAGITLSDTLDDGTVVFQGAVATNGVSIKVVDTAQQFIHGCNKEFERIREYLQNSSLSQEQALTVGLVGRDPLNSFCVIKETGQAIKKLFGDFIA